MKNLKKISYWTSVSVVGIVLGVSLQFAAAWTEPTVAPPGANVGAPINTSSTSQIKSGALGVNGFSNSGNTNLKGAIIGNGAWGAGTLEVHNGSWDGTSNNNYGTIATGHGYYYGGLQSGGGSGWEAGNGELYVAGKSMLLGNVGIGTTSPAEKLDVVGNVKVSNMITSSGIKSSGTIESTSGGIKFPDGTVQATAAVAATHVAGGLYGNCTRINTMGQWQGSTAKWPASYNSKNGDCTCATGYTLVVTGSTSSTTISPVGINGSSSTTKTTGYAACIKD